MSLPTNESVKRFLNGLGTDEPEVVASLEAMGARDKPGINGGYDEETATPVTRNCVMAMALKIEFPELVDDDRWAVGSLCVRFNDEAAGGYIEGQGMRLVNLPSPVQRVMVTVDNDRAQLILGHNMVPTYPNLLALAPRKE